jgi:hypothetical protein
MAPVMLADSDSTGAAAELAAAVGTAERYRLPHQVQRAVGTAGRRLRSIGELGEAALCRLVAPSA